MADQNTPAVYQYFASIQLSKDDRRYKWDPTIVEKEYAADKAKGLDEIRHSLRLTQVILGDSAVDDELNVIEVETTSIHGSQITTPMAFLKAGTIYQATINVELPDSSVTFHLKKGSGPIFVAGLHTVTLSYPEDGTEVGDDESVDSDEEAEVGTSEMETDDAETDEVVKSKSAPAATMNGDVGVTSGQPQTENPSEETNDKKRKIEDADEVDDGDKENDQKLNGTPAAPEEEGSSAKKAKLVADVVEKPAEDEVQQVPQVEAVA